MKPINRPNINGSANHFGNNNLIGAYSTKPNNGHAKIGGKTNRDVS